MYCWPSRPYILIEQYHWYTLFCSINIFANLFLNIPNTKTKEIGQETFEPHSMMYVIRNSMRDNDGGVINYTFVWHVNLMDLGCPVTSHKQVAVYW